MNFFLHCLLLPDFMGNAHSSAIINSKSEGQKSLFTFSSITQMKRGVDKLRTQTHEEMNFHFNFFVLYLWTMNNSIYEDMKFCFDFPLISYIKQDDEKSHRSVKYLTVAAWIGEDILCCSAWNTDEFGSIHFKFFLFEHRSFGNVCALRLCISQYHDVLSCFLSPSKTFHMGDAKAFVRKEMVPEKRWQPQPGVLAGAGFQNRSPGYFWLFCPCPANPHGLFLQTFDFECTLLQKCLHA